MSTKTKIELHLKLKLGTTVNSLTPETKKLLGSTERRIAMVKVVKTCHN